MTSLDRIPSLKSALVGFVALTGLAASATLFYSGDRRLDDYEQSVLQEIAERRASATAHIFARALWGDWRDVSTVASSGVSGDVQRSQAMLDLIVGDGTHISWAGIAAPDGTVVAASRGMLLGASVAERPWFQRGLDGPFAGDVHEAKLLAGLLPGADERVPRFLDLSAPIATGDGTVTGVVGVHIDQAWANRILADTADAIGVEAMLVDRAGKVVVGPDEMLGQTFASRSTRAAMIGAGGTAFLETWPDGSESLSAVVPALVYRDLPPFGFSLVARVDPATLAGARIDFTDALVVQGVAIMLVLLAATLMFVRYYVRPMTKLAEDAERIADGQDLYPTESLRTRELALLSGAVAKMQARSARVAAPPEAEAPPEPEAAGRLEKRSAEAVLSTLRVAGKRRA